MTEWLRVQGLGKAFGSLEVLRDVSFHVDCSETVALVGPSGCGKTTLLRILLGLESADTGRWAPTLDRTGYLPQGTLLFPWKRMMENLELPLQLNGMARDERRKVVRQHLSIFGLEGFERAYPHELSGGMQQRAALLRAVCAGAEALLLDEPFGALDTVTRHRLQDWLADVVEQLGSTMIFVTHDVEEAVALAHRILALCERPATLIGELTLTFSLSDRANRFSKAFLDARNALVEMIDGRSAIRAAGSR